MVILPSDILSDILVRLPVKSIARFRCVNKGWCYLLKNPKFLKRQYKHAVEMNRFSIMFHNQNDIYTFSYDPSSSTCERSGHIEYPAESSDKGIEFFGSCNGLVLLRHITKIKSHVLILWNPATNESKKLPDPPTRLKEQQGGLIEYGIGYDHQIEDFKIVRLAVNIGCEVQVYTLGSNSWRRLEDIPVDMIFYTYYTPDMSRLPVNGAFHWKVLTGAEYTEIILRFDFEKEEFSQISLPDEINDNQDLCVLGGSLWLLVTEYGYTGYIREFWELKDNEGKKSWAHSFGIDIDKIDSDGDLIPLQFLENGNILFGVLRTCLHIVLYDQKHDTSRTLNAYEDIVLASSWPTSVYVESLISLDTGTYLGQVQRDKVDNDNTEEEHEEDYEEDWEEEEEDD